VSKSMTDTTLIANSRTTKDLAVEQQIERATPAWPD